VLLAHRIEQPSSKEKRLLCASIHSTGVLACLSGQVRRREAFSAPPAIHEYFHGGAVGNALGADNNGLNGSWIQ
jgi:hypothetical protein